MWKPGGLSAEVQRISKKARWGGTYAQLGQMGSATGTFACANGETGNFPVV